MTAQGFTQRPALEQLQITVRQGQTDTVIHLHQPVQERSSPFRGQYGDFTIRILRLQTNEQGLGHHHIPYPGRPYDKEVCGTILFHFSVDYIRRRNSQNLVDTGYTRSYSPRTTQP